MTSILVIHRAASALFNDYGDRFGLDSDVAGGMRKSPHGNPEADIAWVCSSYAASNSFLGYGSNAKRCLPVGIRQGHQRLPMGAET